MVNRSGWIQLPSPYPELKCFGIVVEPLQYAVTVNTVTGETIASMKQYPDKGAKEVIGTFEDFHTARDACAAHWIKYTKGTETHIPGGKNANG